MSENETKIINHAITRWLSRREHSYQELLQKLLAKEYSHNLCEQQLQQFVDKGIQSDTRFTEAFIRNAYISGKGPQQIRQKLYQHKINETVMNQFIDSDQFDWFESAAKVRAKKFGALPHDFESKQKQMRFLQYRGFEQDHINECV
ncbi:MAG: regulatory protein RecX [Glaciecola sp.]